MRTEFLEQLVFVQGSAPAGRRYWSEQPLKGSRQNKRERERRTEESNLRHTKSFCHYGQSWELHQNKQPQLSGVWWQIRPDMAAHPWTAHRSSAFWNIKKPVAFTLWSFSLLGLEVAVGCCLSFVSCSLLWSVFYVNLLGSCRVAQQNAASDTWSDRHHRSIRSTIWFLNINIMTAWFAVVEPFYFPPTGCFGRLVGQGQ